MHQSPFALAPAILESPLRILGRQIRKWFVTDQLCSGIDKSARFLAGLGEINNVVDAAHGHFLGKLHDSRDNLALFDVLDSKTTTVNGCQNDIFLLAGLLDGRV